MFFHWERPLAFCIIFIIIILSWGLWIVNFENSKASFSFRFPSVFCFSISSSCFSMFILSPRLILFDFWASRFEIRDWRLETFQASWAQLQLVFQPTLIVNVSIWNNYLASEMHNCNTKSKIQNIQHRMFECWMLNDEGGKEMQRKNALWNEI